MNKKILISENERSRILDLHKGFKINESKNLLKEVDLTQIQQLLIDKKLMSPTLTSGRTSVDGRLGPVTLNAIYSALTQTQGTQPTGTPAGTNPTGTPAGTNPTGTQPTGTQPTGTQPTETSAGTENVNLEVGKIYEGTFQDNAEGKVLKVLSITPVPGCDVKEVALKMTEGVGYTLYGYLQGTDLSAKNMRRESGEALKSQNPCEEIKKDMISFGILEPEGTMKKLGLK